MENKPNDGDVILVWNFSAWEFAWYSNGKYWGAHHSSSWGNELDNIYYWMEQPPAPKGEI